MNQFKKGSQTRISNHFRAFEFDCKCTDCGQTLIDDDLLRMLDRMRDALLSPIEITSGYRCQAYQNKLRSEGYDTAAGISQHELGKAADIETGKHTGDQLEACARGVGFKAIGVGKGWVHVDTRDSRDRRWTYPY